MNTPRETIGIRLERAMASKGLVAVDLARMSETTEATISNWSKDRVNAEHVKAAVLFRIADALGVDAQELLTGKRSKFHVQEAGGVSQSVQPETLTLALQLVEEALSEQGKSLPPAKKAEAVQLVYDLINEGLPQAKVLRFARAAVG